MTIKTILVCASGEPSIAEAPQVTCGLDVASRFDAHVTALIQEDHTISPRRGRGPRIGGQASAVLAEDHSAILGHAAQLEALAVKSGVVADVLTVRCSAHTVPEEVANRARLHDLCVTSIGRHGLLSQRATAEFTLFNSGRPLIVVPPGTSSLSIARVIVAWDGSRAAARAMAEALPILREAKEVLLVAFEDDKPLASRLSAQDVLTSLARRCVDARFVRAGRSEKPIGEAINAFCVEQDAGLLVMGGHGHSRFREFILGGATRAILEAPIVPTFMAH